jgi:hypothetical protein
VFGDPARNSFAHLQSNIPKVSLVGDLGCPKNHLIGLVFYEIDQTGVASGHMHGQANNFAQHFVQ